MWGVHAAAWVAMASIVIHTPPTMVRARKLRHVAGFSMRATVINAACVWGAFVAFGLCVLNIPPGRAAALYLVGLMGLLGSTVTLFSRVIVSMLRPYQHGDEPL